MQRQRTLCGRVISALRSQALLNESVGAGHIERNWPPALKESGAWPLSSLRQSFLNGSLTRLLDPDTILRGKLVEFVTKGEFGLASVRKPDGTYERILFEEAIDPAEVAFEPGVFLLLNARARALKAAPETAPGPAGVKPALAPESEPAPILPPQPEPAPGPENAQRCFRISGEIPPEVWNRLGTRILPKLRGGSDLKVCVDFSVTIDGPLESTFEADILQILEDLNLRGNIRID